MVSKSKNCNPKPYRKSLSFIQKLQFEIDQLFRARVAYDPKRLLYIEHKIPEPDIDAGSRANLEFLKSLIALGYSVTFLETNRKINPDYAPFITDLGVKLFSYPDKYARRWLRKNARSFHYVVLSRPEIAEKYLPLIRKHSKAKTIFFGHDIHFERLSRQANILGQPSDQNRSKVMEEIEKKLWNLADLTLYLSQEEADVVRSLEPAAKVDWIIPYSWETFAIRTAPPRSQQLLFLAGFGHSPNIDAACWLVRDILPLLRSNPDVKLILAGSNPTSEVLALASSSVDVLGYVTDATLADLYQTSRVAVIPLRFGAGVKLKVVEALHAGIPVVTTPTGIQGLQALDKIVTATTESHLFAQAVAELLTNDSLWLERSRQQSDYVQQTFSRRSHVQSVNRALSQI